MDDQKSRSGLFNGDVGRFTTAEDAKERTRQYRRFKEERLGEKPGEYTLAEFFGINRINKLLGREDCVGIRVYYGKRYEDTDGDPTSEGKGELKPRLVLVGVRRDGSDIFDSDDRLTGMKDMPARGDGDALVDGHACPNRC